MATLRRPPAIWPFSKPPCHYPDELGSRGGFILAEIRTTTPKTGFGAIILLLYRGTLKRVPWRTYVHDAHLWHLQGRPSRVTHRPFARSCTRSAPAPAPAVAPAIAPAPCPCVALHVATLITNNLSFDLSFSAHKILRFRSLRDGCFCLVLTAAAAPRLLLTPTRATPTRSARAPATPARSAPPSVRPPPYVWRRRQRSLLHELSPRALSSCHCVRIPAAHSPTTTPCYEERADCLLSLVPQVQPV